MRLREIMSTRVVTIAPREPASVAWSRMQRLRIRHLVVTENAHLVGVVSERDLGGRNGEDIRRGRMVQDLMTTRVVSAEPKTTLRQAANLMRGRTIGSLPVFEGNRLVGIVTATDVLDELGRGSTRPNILAERPTLRLPANSKRLGGRADRPSPPTSQSQNGTRTAPHGRQQETKTSGEHAGQGIQTRTPR
jgi:CBS domain-containing protein